VKAIFEKADLGDIPGAGLHCLRRTWATMGLESGHSLATVQREGGWASPQVLLDSYARPTEEQRARLAEGVSDALGLRIR
jgi:integrase